MAISKQDALEHLASVIEAYESNRQEAGFDEYVTEPSYVRTRLINALTRLAPPGSEYANALRADFVGQAEIHHLAQLAKALQADYVGGYLGTFTEIFNADLFSDFLKMAEYLLQNEKLKQPAAVLAGGVLEEHIRKLCHKHGVSTEVLDVKGKTRPKKLDVMNTDLRQAGVVGQNDQKQLTAWYGIRNSAAHAKYDDFDEAQVSLMIKGIRTFIARFPA